MAWDTKATDEFQAWWSELSEAAHEAIIVAITVLEEKGPALGRARVDTLAKDSKHPNMKELRVQFSGKLYRICFAFDLRQTGILLIGGIKSRKIGPRKSSPLRTRFTRLTWPNRRRRGFSNGAN